MKALVNTQTKYVVFMFEDADVVTIEDDMVCAPDQHFILDLNKSNAILVENVTPPEDWAPSKYLYDNGIWTVRSTWSGGQG